MEIKIASLNVISFGLTTRFACPDVDTLTNVEVAPCSFAFEMLRQFYRDWAVVTACLIVVAAWAYSVPGAYLVDADLNRLL